MADLPQALGLLEEWLVGYADDVALWASDKDPEIVKSKLEKHAADFATFAAEQGQQPVWLSGMTYDFRPPRPGFDSGWRTTDLDTC